MINWLFIVVIVVFFFSVYSGHKKAYPAILLHLQEDISANQEWKAEKKDHKSRDESDHLLQRRNGRSL